MKLFSGVILIQGIPFLMFSSFTCIFLGLLLGRITIKGVSLGASGVFIIALIYGALFSGHISSTVSQKDNGKAVDISSNALKIIENIGLILFIGSVGFISGPKFFSNLKKNFKSYILSGLFIILVATLTCVVCFYIGKSSASDVGEFNAIIVGIFSGALTSTPAFSAAKSTADTKYESAVTVGHGIAYLFGVIGVVLFVQIVPKILGVNMDIERALIGGEHIEKRIGTEKTDHPLNIAKSEDKKDHKNKIDMNKEEEKRIEYDPKRITTEQIESTNRQVINSKEVENENHIENNENEEKEEKEDKDDKQNKGKAMFTLDENGLCVYGFGSILGIFIGAIRIPLSNKLLDGTTFSFTTTGGVLITTLVLGHYGHICCLSLEINKKILEVFRELGLILFLLGTGIAGGAKFIEYFKAVYFIYGIVMTLVPLILGFIFCKYALKLCLLNNLGSLTGGMTSTPALGTLISVAQTDHVGGAYAATYPIALISIVLASQFMVLLMK